jgi:hypothetical protein
MGKLKKLPRHGFVSQSKYFLRKSANKEVSALRRWTMGDGRKTMGEG